MSNLSIEPGSTTAYHTGEWRQQRPVYRDKWPPCGQSCPASEDIQAYLALASNKEWEAAWRKITERNPLPGVTGRVCHHPCETSCNRTQLDTSINIHGVERFLGDLAHEKGWRHERFTEVSQPQKVAVVGAGPAGLSCAFQLARRGYPVTIFDAMSAPGGTLRSAIPDYRLPKSVLSGEIDAILALGIELRLDTRIGQELSEQSLQDDFDAVFLAIGALKPRSFSSIDKSDHSVMSGTDFLQKINRGKSLSLPKQVAVIGGGNTAIDVARCARRLGAQVTVVCSQDRPGSHHGHADAQMPALPQEAMHAEAEGVRILFRTGVRRLVRNGQHLSGVEISRVDQVHDRQGRFNPVLFEGTETFLSAGLVIFAIGQEVNKSGLENLMKDGELGVIIGGDAAGKPRFAATAIGSGYQSAMSIIAYLTGIPPVYENHQKTDVTYKDLHTQYYPLLPRQDELMTEDRLSDFTEIVKGFSQGETLCEASRCLSCGVCFDCDNCWHFCPDAAVIKKPNGYEIDYNYCKGCGICALECPSGHIDMQREVG
ncbi:MAG: FAD-dependent oxidoreductase [Gammaproteobacteria bacterium]|nr:FAD-dependent oxidoreductase [Gammaproteobacteria bacterium]